MRKIKNKKKGFTLIEVLVVIGIISILASVVIVAVNPARQFKQARDSQRTANVNAILNAIGQNIAEHKGTFYCLGSSSSIPAEKLVMKIGGEGYNVAPCLVPDYLPSMPYDQSLSGAYYSSLTEYNTGYSVVQDKNGRVTISATSELDPETLITVTR